MAFPGLSALAEDREAEIASAVEQAKGARNDTAALYQLLGALDEIREALAQRAVEDVTVNNLDEVKAALRNELTKVSKPIISAIDKLSIDRKKIEAAKADVEKKNKEALEDTHDIQIVRKPKMKLTIDNIQDLAIPDTVAVKNLGDLQQYFINLGRVIEDAFDIEIPVPQVTVPAPIVNVPETKIDIPAVEFAPLLRALDPLKFISDLPNKPISVRLSDGKKFMKAVAAIVEGQQKQVAAFSQGLNEASARKAFKQARQDTIGGSGFKELTSAGTAVAITATSTTCKYVDISVNAGVANVGASTAVQTSDGEIGVTIYPGNLPYRVHTNNLTSVYAAGAAGTRLSWTYYV